MELKIGDRVSIDYYASRFHKCVGTVTAISNNATADSNSVIDVHFDMHLDSNKIHSFYKYKIVKLKTKTDLINQKIKQLEDKFKNRKNKIEKEPKKFFEINFDWNEPVVVPTLEETCREMENMFEEEEFILRNGV